MACPAIELPSKSIETQQCEDEVDQPRGAMRATPNGYEIMPIVCDIMEGVLFVSLTAGVGQIADRFPYVCVWRVVTLVVYEGLNAFYGFSPFGHHRSCVV